MSSIVKLHPILNHYLSVFKERDYLPSGICTGNMDELTIEKSLEMKGGYLVCAATIQKLMTDFIRVTGPGGGLIAATKVQLKASDITLAGDANDPIKVVALENLSLNATDLKIQNVEFYLLEDAKFSMYASTFSKVENVHVLRLKMNDQKLIETVVAHWQDSNALDEFINQTSQSLKQEDSSAHSTEALLERWSWEREAVRKVGLRSLLV